MSGNVDMGAWTRYLQGAVARLRDLTPVHEKIGEYMVVETQDNFRTSGGREQWQPLAPATLTAQRRRYGTFPLMKTRRLMRGIRYDARKAFVDIGSDFRQARAQFFGYKYIPARSPFKYLAGVLEPIGDMYTAFIFGER